MKGLPVALWLLLAAQLPARALAKATFVVQARGAGFADATLVAAQGGNEAKTLGDQRRAAVQYAADLWGARLDSAVPIVLDVLFRDLGCEENTAVLAGAASVSLFSGIAAPGADPALWYPGALANRLAGRDLAADEADIHVVINSAVDDACRGKFGGFYYGFDRKGGSRVDLVEVILHELAHGLGFSSAIDLDSGMPEEGGLDVFSSHIFDVAAQKSWRELTNDERRLSALKVRGLSFRGARTAKAALEVLAKGAPTLTLDPAPAGFVGAVGDSGSQVTVEGQVRLADSFQGCAARATDLSGALVLIRPDCPLSELEPRLIAAGARGVLLARLARFTQPALAPTVSERMSTLPAMVLSVGDAELLLEAIGQRPLQARMHWDNTRTVGADSEGRPLLFASQPADEGSSVSHFEPLARPDLLMEPFIGLTARHAFDLAWPVMMDLGWEPFCGNGRLDPDEQCDQGPANSDLNPNSCRANCMSHRCGDAVIDASEACDDGARNSDETPNACRRSCVAARCGDGVVDRDEACDDGSANSDTTAGACRTRCVRARCGDGVVDPGEQCDGADGCSPSCERMEVVDDCGPKCEPTSSARESAWLDPWDAPRDDVEPTRAKRGGCGLAPSEEHSRVPSGVLLLVLLALGRAVRSRRARP